MKINKNDFLFIIATIFSLWFIGTGYIWVYWIAVIFSYPFGIASFLIWRYLKKDGKKRNKIIPILLSIGLILSVSILLIVLLRN